jgi:hypothetical protein
MMIDDTKIVIIDVLLIVRTVIRITTAAQVGSSTQKVYRNKLCCSRGGAVVPKSEQRTEKKGGKIHTMHTIEVPQRVV